MFVATFTHVLSGHYAGKFSNHTILSFDIIIKYIKSFSEVYLPFKHDVIAAQTVVDNYLILPKVILETDDLLIPAPLESSIPVVSSRVWSP